MIESFPKGLKKRYAEKFPDRNLHHVIPRSRQGISSQFNLFPYNKKSAHPAYHDIFWNMRIDEVWRELSSIHYSIFESSFDFIYTPWIDICILEVGPGRERQRFEEKKQRRLEKTISVDWLRDRWIKAFGSDSLDTARKKLKEMMLYMVFGVNMLSKNILFNNDHLAEFLELSPWTDERLWAFQICFGRNGCSVQAMKSRIARILK